MDSPVNYDLPVITLLVHGFAEERAKMTPEEIVDYEAMLRADHAGDEEETERLLREGLRMQREREAGSQRSA